MRSRNILFVVSGLCFIASLLNSAAAQAPSRPTAPSKVQKEAVRPAPSPQVFANLAQLMRAIMFPNSNVIFYAQDKNPADVKPAGDGSLATDPLSGTFGGWAAVENSSLALAEATNLLTIPGRICSNGRPVPVKNADWLKFVQGLRDAGMTSYKAAQSKSNEKMLDAADAVTTACSNCHDRYREKPGGVADRCM